MRVFYYPAFPSHGSDSFLQSLQREIPLQNLIALPGGCRLNSSFSLTLRKGDILILFAGNAAELDELLFLQDEFLAFKKVLVLARSCNGNCLEKAHLLQPRFMTSADELSGLTAVVKKMLQLDTGISSMH